MYTFNVVEKSTATDYENLTFPSFRNLLQNIYSDQSIVAIAASHQEKPVALALAKIKENNKSGEVLSIFVETLYRNTGLGTSLLKRLEQEIRARDCKTIEMVYMTGQPTTPVLERLLHKCDWEVPQARMLVCKGNEKILEAPWISKYSHLPSSYNIFPWNEITEQERQVIKEQQETQAWIPEDLIPFKHENNCEPLNSLGLRYQGQVVGWVINHRLSQDTIRYTCSFVRKDLQKMGRIISLYAEAAKRQYEVNILKCIWTVPLQHESMVNFVNRHWAPYLNSLKETRGSFKALT
jgi:GNAT superfamily N-acetyltransferase